MLIFCIDNCMILRITAGIVCGVCCKCYFSAFLLPEADKLGSHSCAFNVVMVKANSSASNVALVGDVWDLDGSLYIGR